MKLPIKVEKIFHVPGDEMLGFRTGWNSFRKYFRIDLWSISFRITRDFDELTEFNRLYEKLTKANKVVVTDYVQIIAVASEQQLVISKGLTKIRSLLHDQRNRK